MASPTHVSSYKYESVFCIFLFVLAFLYRDNTNLVYPHILYLLLILLLLNLTANAAFQRFGHPPWLSTIFILANCATITAILNYSGKENSNMWVLYLLPIYTVCMLLEG